MFTSKIKKLIKEGSLRSLKQRENLLDFTSNDYLGLARDLSFQQEIISLWKEWSDHLPQKVGSTGSRLLTGNHVFFEEAEEKIAHFHGFSTATLFNCGYMANLGLLSCLFTPEDTLIADLEVHASIHDGMRLSKARKFYFRHNDLNHLERRLKTNKNCFILVESLYSMSGNRAPLKEMISLGEKYGAQVIVDEAHAIGVLGPQGRGLIAEENLQDKVLASIGAFGKGLGVHGAVVLGSFLLKKMLLNFSRPLIYTTAIPLPLLAAIVCTYTRFPKMHQQRQQIANLCQQFNFPSHIHPFFIRGNSSVKLASQHLAHLGYDIRPICSPTVPKDQERLRLTLHSFNQSDQLQDCLKSLQKWRGL